MKTADKFIVIGFIICITTNILFSLIQEPPFIERLFDIIWVAMIFYGAGIKSGIESSPKE